MHRYYHTCRSHVGKVVDLTCRDGRHYVGRIRHVTHEHVYMESVGRRINGKEDNKEQQLQHAVGKTDKEQNGERIFFFAPFAIPLAAIAGLTIVGTAPFWGRGFYGRGVGYGRGFW